MVNDDRDDTDDTGSMMVVVYTLGVIGIAIAVALGIVGRGWLW